MALSIQLPNGSRTLLGLVPRSPDLVSPIRVGLAKGSPGRRRPAFAPSDNVRSGVGHEKGQPSQPRWSRDSVSAPNSTRMVTPRPTNSRETSVVGTVKVESHRHRSAAAILPETRWQVRCSECGLISELIRASAKTGSSRRRRRARQRQWFPSMEVACVKQQLHAQWHRAPPRPVVR